MLLDSERGVYLTLENQVAIHEKHEDDRVNLDDLACDGREAHQPLVARPSAFDDSLEV